MESTDAKNTKSIPWVTLCAALAAYVANFNFILHKHVGVTLAEFDVGIATGHPGAFIELMAAALAPFLIVLPVLLVLSVFRKTRKSNARRIVFISWMVVVGLVSIIPS